MYTTKKLEKEKGLHKNATHWSSGVFQGPAAVRVCKLCAMDVSPPPFSYASPREKKSLFTYTSSRGREDPYIHTRRCNFPPAHKKKKERRFHLNQ